MMRITSLILFVFFVVFAPFAQQTPQYAQWNFHQFAVNPAHAGIKDCIDLHSVFRAQWVGIKGAPYSGFVTASVPLKSKRDKYLSYRHGIGAKFEADRIGQFAANRVNLAYASHMNFSEYNRLSLGIYAGILQFGFNHGEATTITPDPTVMREMVLIRPDAHFGAWWNGKNYYIGFMANQLIVSKWKIGDDSRFRLNFALNGAYRYAINENFTLIPSLMFRIPIIGPANADINLHMDYQNIVTIGVGYRTQDALLISAGFKISQRFGIQYAFEYTVSGLNKVSNHTHEVGISFLTCRPVNTSTSKCPLFE
jgi:type IX secretion system PorP/SprF family membrane protein